MNLCSLEVDRVCCPRRQEYAWVEGVHYNFAEETLQQATRNVRLMIEMNAHRSVDVPSHKGERNH